MSAPALLLGCLAMLLLMAAGAVAVLKVQGQRDRRAARIVAVTARYRRGVSLASAPATTGVGVAEVSQGLGRSLARVMGFDPALQDQYILRWPVAVLLALVASIATARLASALAGPLAQLGILPLWVMYSRSFFAWCVQRRRASLFVQFPDALAMIVRAVRVGIPVTDCIRAVGRELSAPTGPEFARLGDELAIGVPLVDALQAMAARNELQEYRFFATALALQNQTGGGLSETLENLADVIRKRVALRQKGNALSAEAKTSAMVLAVLPPLAGAALWVLNPEYGSLLITDATGNKILATAALGLFLGVMTMRLLIRKSLS